jgi:hypothetical protein
MAAAVADISAPWRRDGFAVPGLLDEAFQSGRNNMTKALSLIAGLVLTPHGWAPRKQPPPAISAAAERDQQPNFHRPAQNQAGLF